VQTERVRLVRLVQTCTACPSQWDAWAEDGTYYYVRYRHGTLTVNRDDVCGELVLSEELDLGDGGWMSEDEMLEATGFVPPPATATA
jgi:hypothetical protein